MRKLALVFCGFAILFLAACEPSVRERRIARAEVDREDPATVLTIERLDFPKHGGSADGTKAGCIYIHSGISCVKLGSI